MKYQTKKELRAALQGADRELRWAVERRSTAEAALEEALLEVVDLNVTIDLKTQQLEEQTQYAEDLRNGLIDRTQGLRLNVLQTGGWSSMEEIAERATWVIDGVLPERRTSGTESKDVPTEGAKSNGQPSIPVPPGGFESTVKSLEYVAEKLEQVRLDPQLSVGKVRLQRIAVRLDYAIAEVRSVLGLPAEEVL